MSSNRYGIPVHAAVDPRLGHAELRVLCLLCSYCDDDGRCWPKNSTLAGQMKTSVRTIERHVRRLADLGWITRADRLGISSLTVVNFDFRPGGQEAPEPSEEQGGNGTPDTQCRTPPTPSVGSTPDTQCRALPTLNVGPYRHSTSDPADTQRRPPPDTERRTELIQGTNPLKRVGAKPPSEPAAPPLSMKVSSGSRPKGNKFQPIELTEETPVKLWAYAVEKRDNIDVHETYRLFRAYHEDERKTEAQWLRLWRLWVAREKPVCPILKDATKPPKYHAAGDTMEKFSRKALMEYRASLRIAGVSSPSITQKEEISLNCQANEIFLEKGDEYGIEMLGVIWSAAELKERVNGPAPGPRLVEGSQDRRSAAS